MGGGGQARDQVSRQHQPVCLASPVLLPHILHRRWTPLKRRWRASTKSQTAPVCQSSPALSLPPFALFAGGCHRGEGGGGQARDPGLPHAQVVCGRQGRHGLLGRPHRVSGECFLSSWLVFSARCSGRHRQGRHGLLGRPHRVSWEVVLRSWCWERRGPLPFPSCACAGPAVPPLHECCAGIVRWIRKRSGHPSRQCLYPLPIVVAPPR